MSALNVLMQEVPTTIPSVHFNPTEPQKLAMCRLLNTALAKRVAGVARAMGLPQPTQHDFAALRQDGLSVRPAVGSYDRLTPLGTRIAEREAYQLGRKYQIHVIIYSETDLGMKASCPCGWSISTGTSRKGYATYLARYGAQHCADVPPAYRYACEAK